jgi:hypothetical protein
MRYLKQTDPAWSQDKIGSSSLTVARFGCTLTCVSMLSDYFNCYISPKDIAKNKSWFTKPSRTDSGGLIIWRNLDFFSMAFKARLYTRNDQAILAALKDPDMATILEVNNKSHWVVALRKSLFGGYVCLDPLDGKKKVFNNITGSAIFERK